MTGVISETTEKIILYMKVTKLLLPESVSRTLRQKWKLPYSKVVTDDKQTREENIRQVTEKLKETLLLTSFRVAGSSSR